MYNGFVLCNNIWLLYICQLTGTALEVLKQTLKWEVYGLVLLSLQQHSVNVKQPRQRRQKRPKKAETET